MAREIRSAGGAIGDELASAVGRLDTLEDVLHWGAATRWDVVDVIVQDEFTHDVVVRGPGAYLVFDTT
jgi:hypothetical protein